MGNVDVPTYKKLSWLNRGRIEEVVVKDNSDNARYVMGIKTIKGIDPSKVKKNKKK